MIEIVILDRRGFIIDWRHFKDNDFSDISLYIQDNIITKNMSIITIKKWKEEIE